MGGNSSPPARGSPPQSGVWNCNSSYNNCPMVRTLETIREELKLLLRELRKTLDEETWQTKLLLMEEEI